MCVVPILAGCQRNKNYCPSVSEPQITRAYDQTQMCHFKTQTNKLDVSFNGMVSRWITKVWIGNDCIFFLNDRWCQ